MGSSPLNLTAPSPPRGSNVVAAPLQLPCYLLWEERDNDTQWLGRHHHLTSEAHPQMNDDQNRDTYWARISEYYNRQKESSWPEQNDNAINCPYTFINRETSKFCGFLQQILNRQESGRTIEEKTNDAHIMFKEMDPTKKKPFTLMHCYIEFSKYPKWQTRELETSVKKQKKTIDAGPGTATNDPADASLVRTDATSIRTDALKHEKRPDGVKKDKRGKADDIASKLSLETVWAAKQEKDEVKEAARNARYAQQLELRKEEIALKRRRMHETIGRMHEDSLN
ncbi:hypothetical protein D1007_07572 [Hordeum vulgare]|nr:hypothetical protein D1007_07572 [Hordeum vulgare]